MRHAIAISERTAANDVSWVCARRRCISCKLGIQFYCPVFNTSIELCYSYRNGLDSVSDWLKVSTYFIYTIFNIIYVLRWHQWRSKESRQTPSYLRKRISLSCYPSRLTRVSSRNSLESPYNYTLDYNVTVDRSEVCHGLNSLPRNSARAAVAKATTKQQLSLFNVNAIWKKTFNHSITHNNYRVWWTNIPRAMFPADASTPQAVPPPRVSALVCFSQCVTTFLVVL
jgi:hypothetical protein